MSPLQASRAPQSYLILPSLTLWSRARLVSLPKLISIQNQLKIQGTSSRGVYCLTRNRSSMVLPKPAFQGILEEISDVEKDECKDGMNLCQEDVEEDTSVSSDEDDTDKHRTLSPQILANSPIFLLPDVTPTTICVATSPLSNSSQPSSVTSQPINIPSRNSSFVSLTSNVIRSSSFQCEQTRRRISSSESSSTTSDSSSGRQYW